MVEITPGPLSYDENITGQIRDWILRKSVRYAKSQKPMKPYPILDTSGKFPAVVLWTSENGKYGVIKGPFPSGLRRSLTRPTVERAAKEPVKSIEARYDTSRGDKFAKVLLKQITPLAQEWGEVCY